MGGEAGEEESLSSVLLPCTKVMERRDSGNYVFDGAPSLQHRPCSETVHVCMHSSRLALVMLHTRFKAVCMAQGLIG